MPEATPLYTPLEISLDYECDTVTELLANELNLDALDIHSSICIGPDNLLLMIGFQKWLAMFAGSSDQGAWQTAYRGYFFAHEVAVLAGQHDFEINIPAVLEEFSSKEQLQFNVEEFLEIRENTDRLIGTFVDDIDVTSSGRYEKIARLSAGLAFMMIEDGMREHYLQEQSDQLGAGYK